MSIRSYSTVKGFSSLGETKKICNLCVASGPLSDESCAGKGIAASATYMVVNMPKQPVGSREPEQTGCTRLMSVVKRVAQGFGKRTPGAGDASQAASCRTMDRATRPAPRRVADAGPHQEP